MKAIEKRRYSRKTLNAQVRIIIFSQVINLLEEGRATVRNISSGGALISDLALPTHSLPTRPFIIDLLIQEGLLSGIHMTCSMVRLSNNGRLSLGLRFDKISEKHRAQLWNFVNSVRCSHRN